MRKQLKNVERKTKTTNEESKEKESKSLKENAQLKKEERKTTYVIKNEQ